MRQDDGWTPADGAEVLLFEGGKEQQVDSTPRPYHAWYVSPLSSSSSYFTVSLLFVFVLTSPRLLCFLC